SSSQIPATPITSFSRHCRDAGVSTSRIASDQAAHSTGAPIMATTQKLPSRLHHTAYVVTDLERTRKFYEDIIGLPLLATWCESDMLFGAERTYCHVFFGLADGGALAFFQFARAQD